MSTKLKISLLKTLKGHKQSIYSICEDGQQGFFSAGSDGFLVHWKNITSNDGELFAQIGEAVYSIFWDKENEQLIAGTQSGHLYILKKGNAPRRKFAHSKGVFAIKKHGNIFVTGGGDGRLIFWDLKFHIKKEFNVFKKSIRDVAIINSNYYVIGSTGECALIQSGNDINIMKMGENSIFAIQINNGTIITAGREAKIRLHTMDFEILESINAHWYTIHTLAMNLKSELLASAGMDKRIRFWELNSMTPLYSIDPTKDEIAHKSSVNKLIWLNADTLVSCSDDAQIKCWKVSII